jgi:hypothetical protein
MKRTPCSPSTLAISCGSLTLATVPWRTASRANSLGTSIELSMCTWASTKPGINPWFAISGWAEMLDASDLPFSIWTAP